jgi:hypothetical protein
MLQLLDARASALETRMVRVNLVGTVLGGQDSMNNAVSNVRAQFDTDYTISPSAPRIEIIVPGLYRVQAMCRLFGLNHTLDLSVVRGDHSVKRTRQPSNFVAHALSCACCRSVDVANQLVEVCDLVGARRSDDRAAKLAWMWKRQLHGLHSP